MKGKGFKRLERCLYEMAAREGFDLFTASGRHFFFRGGIFGAKWSRHYVWIDTFGHHICALIGHSKKTYLWDDGDEQRLICLRCNKKLQSSEDEQ